jgi:GNAT superfamily N-acetyltransferase
MLPSIRRARYQDAAGIFLSHQESIRQHCSKDYTQAEILAWTDRYFRPSLWHQSIDRDFLWVVEENQRILGFGHFAVLLENAGEIMGLYLLPEAIGRGLGREMFKQFITVAKENCVHVIELQSTLTAESFYVQMGCLPTGPSETIEMRGVPIPCIPMKYKVNFE